MAPLAPGLQIPLRLASSMASPSYSDTLSKFIYITSLHINATSLQPFHKDTHIKGWRDGSAGSVLTEQAQSPEFKALRPM